MKSMKENIINLIFNLFKIQIFYLFICKMIEVKINDPKKLKII